MCTVSFVPKDVEIRIYGETAVLTGKVDVNLGRTDFTIRFLEVQRKVDSKGLGFHQFNHGVDIRL